MPYSQFIALRSIVFTNTGKWHLARLFDIKAIAGVGVKLADKIPALPQLIDITGVKLAGKMPALPQLIDITGVGASCSLHC